MSSGAIILRETAISVAINGVLSMLFFLLVFGLTEPVMPTVLAPDFFPQSFMIALMGSLVPSLILRRRLGGAPWSIYRRSLALAIAAAILGGGSGFAICQIQPARLLSPWTALVIKTIYGAVLAAIVTPIAIGALLKPRTTRQ